MQGKWVDFLEGKSDSGKTSIVTVLAKEDSTTLGHIKWFGGWRQYAFFPCAYTVFEPTCMEDIVAVIRELMRTRRKSNTIMVKVPRG